MPASDRDVSPGDDPLPVRAPLAAGPDVPLPPVTTDDEIDVGWGEDLLAGDRGERDARWFEEQRPPHWD